MRAPAWVLLLLTACGPAVVEDAPDRDGDGVTSPEDCDDADPRVKPGLAEECDRLDNDCDGLVDADDTDVTDAAVWYVDADGDGYGTGSQSAILCTREDGYAALPGDCDDADPGVDISTEWYPDADGDGYGDPAGVVTACIPPTGSVRDATDCDDAAADVFPGADEVCGNGVDDDCDGDSPRCTAVDERTLPDDATVLSGVGGNLGVSLLGGVDLDGDAIPDVVAGATTVSGGVVAVFGGASGALLTTYTGELAGDAAGSALANVGDVDGDGDADLLIGASAAGNGGIYRVSGPAAGGSLRGAALRMYGDDAGFGASLAGPGDQDGDGLPDLLVGTTSGGAYVFPGALAGTGALASAVGRVTTVSGSDEAGAVVAALGDLDGDGVEDVAVADPGWDGKGAVFVLLGPLAEDRAIDEADATVLGGDVGGDVGRAVAGGDLDSDGTADVLVGGWLVDGAAVDGGAAWVVSGTVRGEVSMEDAVATIAGELAGEHIGISVASAGDADGDEAMDLLVGGAGSTQDADTHGEALLFHGPLSGAYVPSDADVRWTGPSFGAQAGATVAGAGDLDGEGGGEILVGAPGIATIYLLRP